MGHVLIVLHVQDASNMRNAELERKIRILLNFNQDLFIFIVWMKA